MTRVTHVRQCFDMKNALRAQSLGMYLQRPRGCILGVVRVIATDPAWTWERPRVLIDICAFWMGVRRGVAIFIVYYMMG